MTEKITKEGGGRKALAITVAALFAVTAFAVAFTATDTENNKNEFGEILGAGGAFPMISSGEYHVLALKGDGTVWAWGNNVSGQLGVGDTTRRETPVQVTGGLSGVTAISAGYQHSMALKSDGTVWVWGWNKEGRLGVGDTANRHTPVQVTGLTGVTVISAGNSHSLAIKSDGTVWAWGWNGYGQLGDGTVTERHTPVQAMADPATPTPLTDVTVISAGNCYSLALKSDGTAWAWGYNGNGQLGVGDTTQRETPVQVTGLTCMTAITAGGWHSLAIKSDGTAWAWGSNGSGQLGVGDTTRRETPVQTSIPPIVADGSTGGDTDPKSGGDDGRGGISVVLIVAVVAVIAVVAAAAYFFLLKKK